MHAKRTIAIIARMMSDIGGTTYTGIDISILASAGIGKLMFTDGVNHVRKYIINDDDSVSAFVKLPDERIIPMLKAATKLEILKIGEILCIGRAALINLQHAMQRSS